MGREREKNRGKGEMAKEVAVSGGSNWEGKMTL